jgi:3-oxoacyl-[acyl-carrier-protein] synthase-3
MGRKVIFESIGISLPEKVLSTGELVKSLRIPAIKKFELLTGIKERRICSQGEDSFSLAIAAANDCLNYSSLSGENIEMLISCSITKYRDGRFQQYEPPMSVTVKTSIGAVKAISFDIGNACAGMLTGVMIAEDFISRGVVSNCMVVSGEFISGLSSHALKTIKTPLSHELASLTVGDAGAAVILEASEKGEDGISIDGFTTLCSYSNLCVARQSRIRPGAFMRTRAKKIHEVSIADSGPILREVLKRHGLTFDNIDFLIPHQTSRSAIIAGARQYEEYFGAKPGQVIINLRDYGNTASTSHFITLYGLLSKKRFKKGDRIMLLCFASGLIIGVVIFTMTKMIDRYGNGD